MVSTQPEKDSIAIAKSDLPPSRAGEQYALWLEYPSSVLMAAHPNIPLHGTTEYVLISSFRVDSSGRPSQLSPSSASKFPAFSYASRVLISVERDTGIGEEPFAPFLAGVITGSQHNGTAELTTGDDDALGTDFSSISGMATLFSQDTQSNAYKGEVYFARLNGPSFVEGIDSLPPIPLSWKYGGWVSYDNGSSSGMTFLGSFSFAPGHDSKSQDDALFFPGGRSPQDRTVPVNDLTNGKGVVFVSLEPQTSSAEPPSPFKATLLKMVVPLDQPAGQAFTVSNVATALPTVTVSLTR